MKHGLLLLLLLLLLVVVMLECLLPSVLGQNVSFVVDPTLLACPVSIPKVTPAVAATRVTPLPLMEDSATLIFDVGVRLLPSFYMYEEEMAGADTSALLGCLQKMAGVASNKEGKIDVAELLLSPIFKEGAGRYLGDAILIESLKTHPARVFKYDLASVFIIPVSPILSYMMPKNPSSYGCKLEKPTHEMRMSSVATRLKKLDPFDEDSGRNHLLLCTECAQIILDGPMFSAVKNVILASGRPESGSRPGGKKAKALAKQSIYLPELTLRMILGPNQQEKRNMITPINKRQTKLLIDVSISMDWQEDFFAKLSNMIPDTFASVTRLNDDKMLRSDFTRNHMMAESQFCLIIVVAGRNFVRLFDAIANGCVPIVVASLATFLPTLPFSKLINWQHSAIFVDGLGCGSQNIEKLADVLKAIVNYDDATLLALQRNVLEVYEKLTFDQSIPDFRSQLAEEGGNGTNTIILGPDPGAKPVLDDKKDSGVLWSLMRTLPSFLRRRVPAR